LLIYAAHQFIAALECFSIADEATQGASDRIDSMQEPPRSIDSQPVTAPATINLGDFSALISGLYCGLLDHYICICRLKQLSGVGRLPVLPTEPFHARRTI
jgi:hypothetical protein